MITPDRIAAYARDAGVAVADLPVAVAIALAESGGRERAHNTRPPDDSYGLWQINLYGSLRGRVSEYGLKAPGDLFDPATNARAMARISNGGKNWRPWSTYTSGRHLLFMPVAVAGVAAMPAGKIGNDAVDAVDNVRDTVDGIEAGITKVGAWTSDRNNWIRVAKVAGGVGVLLVGVTALTRGGVTQAITKVVPMGKVAKAAGKVLS